jgi:NAD(P)-dependent dehydrogenase (short-subunit alcohol dehydrogenase family)
VTSDERSIFITGAGAGIGAETARLFAARGWRVGASDVNPAALESLARGLGTGKLSTHVADVGDRRAVESALRDFTAPSGGRLDAVFANAGVLFMGPNETITEEQKNLLIDVNVRGLTEALDIEYRRHDIRVSGIYVVYVQTGMVFDARVKPASIERLGVKVTPQQVAATVWRAVHGRRVHWRVGLDARLINFVVRLLGGGVAPIYARLMQD